MVQDFASDATNRQKPDLGPFNGKAMKLLCKVTVGPDEYFRCVVGLEIFQSAYLEN